jgi:hypothetical protein
VIIYGWIRRAIVLASKGDYCATEGTVVAHGIIRIVTFATLFWIPFLPVKVGHLLICDTCGTTQKLGWRQVRAAMSVGLLPLPPRREWPAFARNAFEETGRMPREQELDPVVKNPRRDLWSLYLTAWLLVVPAVIGGLVVVSLLP